MEKKTKIGLLVILIAIVVFSVVEADQSFNYGKLNETNVWNATNIFLETVYFLNDVYVTSASTLDINNSLIIRSLDNQVAVNFSGTVSSNRWIKGNTGNIILGEYYDGTGYAGGYFSEGSSEGVEKVGLIFYYDSDGTTLEHYGLGRSWSDLDFAIDENGKVQIGGGYDPTYELDVAGDIGGDNRIYHNDDTNTYFDMLSDELAFYAGGVRFLRLDETTQNAFVINEDSFDVDTRIESNTKANAFFVDGSTGYVAVGHNNPTNEFEVEGNVADNIQIQIRNENTDAGSSACLRLYSSGYGNMPAQLCNKPDATGGTTYLNIRRADSTYHQVMTWLGNGNTGINVKAPTTLLNIHQNTTAVEGLDLSSSDSDQSSTRLFFTNSVDDGDGFSIRKAGGTTLQIAYGADVGTTSGTTALTIENTGFVGIGE